MNAIAGVDAAHAVADKFWANPGHLIGAAQLLGTPAIAAGKLAVAARHLGSRAPSGRAVGKHHASLADVVGFDIVEAAFEHALTVDAVATDVLDTQARDKEVIK